MPFSAQWSSAMQHCASSIYQSFSVVIIFFQQPEASEAMRRSLWSVVRTKTTLQFQL